MDQQTEFPGLNDLIKRLKFLRSGSKYLEDLEFDFIDAVSKIQVLAFHSEYKNGIAYFLKSTFIPAVEQAKERLYQILAGITLKVKYGPPTPEKLISMGYSLYQDRHILPKEVPIGHQTIQIEDARSAKERLKEELDYYLEHFKPLVSKSLDGETKDVIKIKKKIKTNLSVGELSMLFKILSDYDGDDHGGQKVLQDYKIKKELHSAVVDCFSSSGTDTISIKSLGNKFGASEQMSAVDYWINKFGSLKGCASLLRQDLSNKYISTGKKTSKARK